MQVSQSIPHPHGVSVFGSAQFRVSPDAAVLQFSVTRHADTPTDAFQETRESAQGVRTFLAASDIPDVQASRITLSQRWNHSGRNRTPNGYEAKSSFNVVLRDLDKLESVLCGVVEAGANEIDDVQFQTADLQEHRNRARQLACTAATQKAELYSTTLGCSVGSVLHIEDINPDRLRRTEGHYPSEPQLDHTGTVEAFDPGSITVSAAVALVFQLLPRNQAS